MELELGDSISLDRTPSPPSRHQKWKRARQRKDGEFTSDATCEVAEKIVSRYFFQKYIFLLKQFGKDEILYVLQDDLVKQTKVGLFTSQDRCDILVEAIGTEEYPRCVYDIGKGIDFRLYFRPSKLSREEKSQVRD